MAFSDPGKYKMLILSSTDWLIYLTIELWRVNRKVGGHSEEVAVAYERWTYSSYLQKKNLKKLSERIVA